MKSSSYKHKEGNTFFAAAKCDQEVEFTHSLTYSLTHFE